MSDFTSCDVCAADPNRNNLYFKIGAGLHLWELTGVDTERSRHVRSVCRNCDRRGHCSSHCDRPQLELRCTYCYQSKHNAENCRARLRSLQILYDRGYVREPIEPEDTEALAIDLPSDYIASSQRDVPLSQRQDYRDAERRRRTMPWEQPMRDLQLPNQFRLPVGIERDWDSAEGSIMSTDQAGAAGGSTAHVAAVLRALDDIIDGTVDVKPEDGSAVADQPDGESDTDSAASSSIHDTLEEFKQVGALLLMYFCVYISVKKKYFVLTLISRVLLFFLFLFSALIRVIAVWMH